MPGIFKKNILFWIFISGVFSPGCFYAQFRITFFQLSVITPSQNTSTSYSSVRVDFGISKGPSCNGYVIYHSTDSLNFYPVYTYPGICGDAQNDQHFSWLHQSPVQNSMNYYKVELVGLETSPAKGIFVGPAEYAAEVKAYPNPCPENTVLTLQFIRLPSDRMFYGKIINEKGFTMREFFGTSSGKLLTLSLQGLEDGFYLIWITDGYQAFRAKIIKKPF